MEIQVAIAKVERTNPDGITDSFEAVERPNGGLSVIQASSHSTSHSQISSAQTAVRRLANHLSTGVRDSAAARAVSDSLFTEFQGRVECSAVTTSVDLASNTLVLCVNSNCPILLVEEGLIKRIDQAGTKLGAGRNIKPIVTEIPLAEDLLVIQFSEGVFEAGNEYGDKNDLAITLQALLEDADPTLQELCDALIAQSVRLERNRPANDLTVLALKVVGAAQSGFRKMNITIPYLPFNP